MVPEQGASLEMLIEAELQIRKLKGQMEIPAGVLLGVGSSLAVPAQPSLTACER